MLKNEKLELKKSYSQLRAIRNYTQHFDIEIAKFLSQTKRRTHCEMRAQRLGS